MKWTEREIARALALQFFQRKHLLVVPNCTWPGNETDLLLVTADLRVIDVEIKISRADFKADAKKGKWFHHWNWKIDSPAAFGNPELRRRREWPTKAWKHYYVMPSEVWADDLLGHTGSPSSGILLLNERRDGSIQIEGRRPAKANREAERITPEDAVNIARLASLRMWDAYRDLDAIRQREVAA